MKDEDYNNNGLESGQSGPSMDADRLPDQLTIPGDPQDKSLILSAYKSLLRSFKRKLEKNEQEMVQLAFELAADAHQNQRRKSGEPYVLHPLEVARICVAEIGLGPTAAIGALLHDVVEDTEVALPEIHAKFGGLISLIVDGLTKLDSLHDSESPQAENISKVLKAMLEDVRVVLIKMADRLHNLRTIQSMPIHKQLRIAAETSTVYAPIAHRLGLYKIKTEFQDTCLKITEPEAYHEIADKLSQTKRDRERYIKAFCQPIEAWLKESNLNAKVVGRPKSIYSIHEKIKEKNVNFEGIYDLSAIRIVINAPPEEERNACWQVYTFVTDYYRPIPERLKDWISSPKANGYESLHTTVIGPNGRYVEVQIRSVRMDDIAERGFAAHWKYKGVENLSKHKRDVFENWLNTVRETLEDNTTGSAVDILNDVQYNLFNEEVHVFTPKGEVRILPKGATALDFAFSIHSVLGSTCQAVKVNNKIVPFDYKIMSGDQVQVVTNKNQKPSEDWYKYVITSKAKGRIKAALNEEKRAQAEYGKEILTRKLNAFKVTVDENVDMLAKWFKYPNTMEFLSAIHLEQVELSELKKFKADGLKLVEIVDKILKVGLEAPEAGPSKPPTNNKKLDIIINNEPGVYYHYSLATCCNPVQGDPIFAYISTTGTRVHRTTCPNAQRLLSAYGHRTMRADWGHTIQTTFIANIIVTGIDAGPGVINQITETLINLSINIRAFTISGNAGFFEGHIGIVVNNTDQLNLAMRDLKKLEWVTNVRRKE
jgi:GTP diphosphokinase / guanosine-3',5'-bis(diphosphate) 3'-diphosphatase